MPDDVNGFTVRKDCFIMKTKSTKEHTDGRYGVIAAKKSFKLAVQRNRAKRLLRDWIAFNEDLMLSNLDYILIARPLILDCKRENGREMIRQAFKDIAKLYNKNVKK